jgi:hypothetical protein
MIGMSMLLRSGLDILCFRAQVARLLDSKDRKPFAIYFSTKCVNIRSTRQTNVK